RVEIRWSAVDQIDVHPTIVIEVKEEPAAATRLREMSQLRAPVVVYPTNLALRRRDFRERHSLHRLLGTCLKPTTPQNQPNNYCEPESLHTQSVNKSA